MTGLRLLFFLFPTLYYITLYKKIKFYSLFSLDLHLFLLNKINIKKPEVLFDFGNEDSPEEQYLRTIFGLDMVS